MPVVWDFDFKMEFPQDVFRLIVHALQAILREAGIKLDVVGFKPNNLNLSSITVCTKHLMGTMLSLLDNVIKYAPLCRCAGRKQGKKLLTSKLRHRRN